ncbi:cyclase family protein [Candidatus Stoquefichus massiliensis]|uniref:cyclase family protein n=1 Tax=Candidatus Stoquefichus massiliensis TaxID=1470350 RepID=UPI000485B359|nr:cyclase family protein [Candidatus Stoquefichus massiliensis]
MFYDLTLKVTPQMMKDANGNEIKSLVGHMGTHFDVMNKEFPLDYLHLSAIVFDVVDKMEIECQDIDLEKVEKGMFVAFATGFMDKTGYGNKEYFTQHPQLSNELIEELIKREIAVIGIDCAGIRRGKEHTPMDQYCANHDVFVIENLCHLKDLLNNQKYLKSIINTYPVNYSDMTGLPCRVVAEI